MPDESNLVKFFGASPFIKIVDAFIDNVGSDFSKKEIQELSCISKGALFAHWGKLEESGIVKQTRAFGNTRLYTVNLESPVVKNIINLEIGLIEATSPKQKVVAIAAAKKQKKNRR
ncbi:MAG: hypothetical protein V1494_00990 [Candidatus Diapherotrites archaeon]